MSEPRKTRLPTWLLIVIVLWTAPRGLMGMWMAWDLTDSESWPFVAGTAGAYLLAAWFALRLLLWRWWSWMLRPRRSGDQGWFDEPEQPRGTVARDDATRIAACTVARHESELEGISFG